MAVQAAQLVGTVEIQGAEEAVTLLQSVGDAADQLQAKLSSLGSGGGGSGLADSLSGASEALTGVSSEVDAAASSFATLDEYLAQFEATDASTAESIAMMGSSLNDVATSALDTATSFDDFVSVSAAAMAEAASANPELSAFAQSLADIATKAPEAASSLDSVATEEQAVATSGKEAEDSTNGLSSIFGDMSGKLSEFGMNAMIAYGNFMMIEQAAKAVSDATVGAAGNFQEEMTQLVTGAGEADTNIGMLSSGMLQLAVDTGTSTEQLSSGMFMIESSGEHGAQALDTLRAAAEGAKVGNADLGTVADATTTILTDFSSTGINASQAVDALITTVASGKTHMQDLAQSLSQILPTASSAKVGLSDVMGAMATMTGEGVPAANAATYLRQTILALDAPSKQTATALESVGLTTKQVANEMQKSLPDTLKMITDAVGKKFPEGSAEYVQALKDIAGGSKQMQGILDLTGEHMQTFSDNAKKVAHDVSAGKNSIEGWALVQQDFNFKVNHAKEVLQTLGIQIGTALLPVVGKLTDWISGSAVPALEAFAKNSDIMIPLLAGLGAILVTLIVPAMASLAVTVVTATWPFLAIGAAVAGLVFIFKHFYDTSAQFRNAINGIASTISSTLGGAFSYIQRQSDESTLRMKIDSINNTLQMKQGVVDNLREERDQVGQLLLHTHDAVTKHMLEMKLRSIDISLQQAQGVVKNMQTERAGVEQQLTLMDPIAHMHMLQMKDQSLSETINMKNGVVEHLVQMKIRVEAEIRATTDPVIKHMLEMKDRSISISLQQADGVIKNAVKQRTGVDAQMKQLQAQTDQENNNFLVRMLHAWDAIRNGVGNAMSQLGTFAHTYILPILQDIGSFIVGEFLPVWKQLQDLWNSQIIPLVKQLGDVFQQLKPVFQLIGGLIGGYLAVAFGTFIGLISGIARGLANFISGLISIFSGTIQAIRGVIGIITGIIHFIIDLFTGNFKNLGNDLHGIWDGIVNIFAGGWKVIQGIFQATIGTVIGFVTGFVQGIIGFFQHLWNMLTGHSIIPDMIAEIVEFFRGLPGKVMTFIINLVTQAILWVENMRNQIVAKIQAFVAAFLVEIINLRNQALQHISDFMNGIKNFFTQLPGEALQWGSNLIHAFLSGIQSAWGAVTGWIGGALQGIRNLFPHSPAKEGPLVDLDKWGPSFIKQFSSGLESGAPQVKAAITTAIAPLVSVTHSVLSPGVAAPLSAPALLPSPVLPGQGVPVILQIDGRAFAKGYLPYHVAAVRNMTGVRF